jgi:hypothetical protein
MNETTILQRVRLAVSKLPGVRIFRNQVGALKDHSGRLVTFGLHPGSADLIGWKSITITPDMVGQRIAVFVSLECKTETGKVKPEQINWLQQVSAAGGIAAVVRDPESPLEFLR